MHQRLLLFLIPFSCIFSELNTYSVMDIKFQFSFRYFHGSSQQKPQWLRISTRAFRRVNHTGSSFILTGHAVNDSTFLVNAVRCVRSWMEDVWCAARFKSTHFTFDNFTKRSDYVFRFDSDTSDAKKLVDLLSLLDTSRINLTCTILYPTTTPFNKPGNHNPFDFTKTSLMGIIVVSICGVLVCGLCTIWFAIIYYRKFRQHRKDNKLRQALAKSTQQMLDKSPIIIFDAENKDNDSADDHPMCAICLEAFQHQEKIRKLVCSHCYHIKCIDPWLLSHQSCPLCNRNILRSSIPSISSTILSGSGDERSNNGIVLVSNRGNSRTIVEQYSNL